MSETTVVKGQFGLVQSGGTGKKLKMIFILQMSRYVKPTENTKQQQIKFVNAVVHLHDMQCDCNSPLEHSVDIIFTQEKNLRFNAQEKQKIRKCLTTQEDGDLEEGVDALGEGVLEALFEQDFGEEENPTATG
mgnify:CR=1 FL=1